MPDKGRPGSVAAALRARSGNRWSIEQFATVMLWCVAIGVVTILLWILSDIFLHGLSQLSGSFFVAAPEDAGRSGGIGPMVVSTLLVLGVTLGVAGPLALAAALALTERIDASSRFSRFVRKCLDILAAVPSIVFGLFGNAFFCVALGMGYSILAGGLTLACMVLPILIRTTEQAIRAVPNDYRYAAAGLGLGRTATLWRVILPAAAPAMGAGLVLSIGRALAETAALIFTAGYVTRMPGALTDSGRVLSVHIYDLAMNVPGGSPRAYATASVLIGLLVLINLCAVSLMQFAGLKMAPRREGSR